MQGRIELVARPKPSLERRSSQSEHTREEQRLPQLCGVWPFGSSRMACSYNSRCWNCKHSARAKARASTNVSQGLRRCRLLLPSTERFALAAAYAVASWAP